MLSIGHDDVSVCYTGRPMVLIDPFRLTGCPETKGAYCLRAQWIQLLPACSSKDVYAIAYVHVGMT